MSPWSCLALWDTYSTLTFSINLPNLLHSFYLLHNNFIPVLPFSSLSSPPLLFSLPPFLLFPLNLLNEWLQNHHWRSPEQMGIQSGLFQLYFFHLQEWPLITFIHIAHSSVKHAPYSISLAKLDQSWFTINHNPFLFNRLPWGLLGGKELKTL